MAITTIKVPGAEALAVLEERRAAYGTSGEYAFLIGDSEDLSRLTEGAEFNEEDPQEIIHASAAINPEEWISKRRAELEEDMGEDYDEDILGDWPVEEVDKGSIGLHKNILTGKIKQEVYIGIVQLEHPWHLPAVLKYGGWNECPSAEEHCAFFRKWEAEYRAEIVGISGDTIECSIAKPPRDREAAIKLAWEQYWYCPDIVDQGCEAISSLAATLLDSPYWYFWWD